jgi:hypothetical protein
MVKNTWNYTSTLPLYGMVLNYLSTGKTLLLPYVTVHLSNVHSTTGSGNAANAGCFVKYYLSLICLQWVIMLFRCLLIPPARVAWQYGLLFFGCDIHLVVSHRIHLGHSKTNIRAIHELFNNISLKLIKVKQALTHNLAFSSFPLSTENCASVEPVIPAPLPVYNTPETAC